MASLELPRIKRSTVSELAMEAILASISQGTLRPGDRVPPQRQLVAQLGLSRPALREALRGLASLGVIEIIPGRGAFVRHIKPEVLIDPEPLLFLLERDSLLHALEVRQILEVEAIGLAAERAGSDDLADIERSLNRIEHAVSSEVDGALQHSPGFHMAIAKATHNPVLVSMVKPFLRLMARGAEVIDECLPEARKQEYHLHYELYEAIIKRNPDEARERMRHHLDVARELILRSFQLRRDGEENILHPESERPAS
jgi:GntR family transcriptional repressor for pyruvate dehydrogenase complex